MTRNLGRQRTFSYIVGQAAQHAQMGTELSAGIVEIAVVLDDHGDWRMYQRTAWCNPKPSDRGLLPWAPPPFPETRIFVVVKKDGSWRKGPAFSEERVDKD